MKNLIAGNWKMNGSVEMAKSLASAISGGVRDHGALLEKNDFLVCPTDLHISTVSPLLKNISLGAQDCSPFEVGAFTGDVSAQMLNDMGCSHVILGHSERRQYYAESNMMIKQKAVMANENSLITIICVGETEEEREQGVQNDVVSKQLSESIPDSANAENTVIAYEPVWAIGTGKVATIEDITSMHEHIRRTLATRFSDSRGMRILYGGSVKPANAAEIFAVENVNGALIGGASLKAEDFIGIAEAS